MIVAGEESGDAHAAKLVEAIREASAGRETAFFGSAGPRMRTAGVDPVVHADDLAIMGLTEIAKALPKFVSVFSKLKRAARERRPDAVVLVDFPEFNLKLAKSLKKCGLKVIYYISPQLWGWRKYRRRTIRDHVDVLLTILPFEKSWYASNGIDNVIYVGSPLVNAVRPKLSRSEFCENHGIDPERPIIAILPGSRRKELSRILPNMIEAAGIMSAESVDRQFVIALAQTRHDSEVDAVLSDLAKKGIPGPARLICIKGQTYDVLNAADAAAVASGTATLEAGLAGTPMAIVYKASSLNYILVRPLIKVEHFGLINLIAGERIMKEMIQDEFTAESLSTELNRLLDPEINKAARQSLKVAAAKLGAGGASRRAAEAVLGIINDPNGLQTRSWKP